MSDEITPTFQGEVQLAGWSETHTGGCKVTFWLPESSDLDVFRALTVRKGNTAGQRFACVLVELSDDDQPAPPPETRPKGGPLAKLAGQWCQSPDFHAFLRSQGMECSNSEAAAAIIRKACRVSSRAELDHSRHAAAVFHEVFRLPYMEWRGEAE